MKFFLHERDDFKALLEITAENLHIQDEALIEKDYWLMHVLWGLQQLNLNFHLKGGTSLSKGFGCIQRFSEDIDIKIEPDKKQCKFDTFTGKNHDKLKHQESRRDYFNWISVYLSGKIPGIINVEREMSFDDDKFRNGGIKLIYDSHFAVAGLKEGILLELGFEKTVPNKPCTISSWAFDKAINQRDVDIRDNRAKEVLCYEPKYTFVEKLQAVIRKFRQYKEDNQKSSLPANFIRHYYDLYQLLNRDDVKAFIGTAGYKEFKKEIFKTSNDINIANSDAFTLFDEKDRKLFDKEYSRSKSLYYNDRPTLDEILECMSKYLDRL